MLADTGNDGALTSTERYIVLRQGGSKYAGYRTVISGIFQSMPIVSGAYTQVILRITNLHSLIHRRLILTIENTPLIGQKSLKMTINTFIYHQGYIRREKTMVGYLSLIKMFIMTDYCIAKILFSILMR